MTKGKTFRFAKAIFSLTLALLAALCAVSCDMEAQPLEFLKKFGDIATVKGVTFSYAGRIIESNGWINIDPAGSEDLVLNYEIDNPGNFDLLGEFSVAGASDPAAVGITFQINSPTSMTVTYPASYLAACDMDTGGSGDISPKIFLTRASDNYGQSYDTRSIRSNAPPPWPSNAVSQIYNNSAQGYNQRLIVCFDIPDLPQDVNLLSICDERTKVTHSFGIENGVVSTGTESNGWTLATASPGTLEPTWPDGPEFYHYTGTAYYLITDVNNLLDLDIFYMRLSLFDRTGLESSNYVPSRVQLLDPLTCSTDQSMFENTFEQAYIEITVYPPANAPDATMNLNVIDSDGNKVADINGNTDETTGNVTFRFYPNVNGTEKYYYMNIWASKIGWWSSNFYRSIYVSGKKLEDPTASPDPASATTFPQDTEVTFTSPQNGNILWVVPGGGSPVSAPSPLKLTLEDPGLNEFDVYAQKDYYQHSGTANFTYIVTLSKVYVKYGATGTGTLLNPAGSINEAIAVLQGSGDPTSPGNKICILGDLPGINGLTSVSDGYYNIIGCDADGNEGVVSSLARVGGGTIIQVNGAGVVSLRAISITGLDNASSGAVNVLDGGTLILKDNVTITGNTAGGAAMNVKLAADQVITVDQANLSGTMVGVTTATPPSGGSEVKITSGYKASGVTDAPSLHFASDAGYAVTLDAATSTDAVLATGGGSFDIGETYSVIFVGGAGSGGIWTFDASATKSSGGSAFVITDDCTWTMKLYYLNSYTGRSSSGDVAAGGNTLDFSGLEAGTYIMKISVVYGGKTYSGELAIDYTP